MRPFASSGRTRLALVLVALAWLAACATSQPLEQVIEKHTRAPAYSVVLEDMEQSGTLFETRRQRFNVLEEWPDGRVTSQLTPWIDVDQRAYRNLAPYLGMAVLARTAEGLVRTPFPPGYHRVGDERCGRWQSSAVTGAAGAAAGVAGALEGSRPGDAQSGGSGAGSLDTQRSWVWNERCRTYGRYVGSYRGGSTSVRPIFWGDWSRYDRSRKLKEPYLGPDGKTFGTGGSYTKASNPTFYERQAKRAQARQSSFDQKSRSRAGRGRGGRRGGK